MRGRPQLLGLLRLWDLQPGPLRLAEMMASFKTLDVVPEDLEDAVHFDDRAYRRSAIYRAENFEALVLCWKAGQCSPIHDHLGSACAVRVVSGRATETRYAPTACGRLSARLTQTFEAGSILGCTGDGIHQMGNLEAPGHDLITLHVYSPPPRDWRYYSVDRTSLADNDRLIRVRPETVYLDLAAPPKPARNVVLRVDQAHKPDPVPSAIPITAELRSKRAMKRSESSADAEVAIVGGGFSGAMVAVHLSRKGVGRVVLFERAERFARGVAYGTTCDRHLLNVPAGLMSALPDEPEHFLQWLRGRDPSAQPSTFASRRLYGDYLGELLASAPGVTLIRDEVVDLQLKGKSDPIELSTQSGRKLTADRVVLALGHQSPEIRADWVGPMRPGQYMVDPWSPAALDGLPSDESVALIGTGLTAVDLVVEARARGHRGTFHAISRHGLLPSRHASAVPRAHFKLLEPGAEKRMTARSVLREVRAEARLCEKEGGDWRSVVDALRPQLPSVWRSLPNGERERFLRHVATRWDVHRHRVAPAIDDELLTAFRAGRLVVTAARVLSLEDSNGRVAVRYQRRGTSRPETLLVGRAINCTGPGRDIRASPSSLLRSIIGRGVGRPGPLALGLEVTDDGALVDCDGVNQTRIFAVGPLLKERDWESTAVRELRTQVVELAGRLSDLT